MRIRLITALVFFCTSIFAQKAGNIDPRFGFVQQILFAREARDVKQLSNGNIIVAGSLWSSPDNDGSIYEFDKNGSLLLQSQNAEAVVYFACDTVDANTAIAVGLKYQSTNEIVFGYNTRNVPPIVINLSAKYSKLDVYDLVTQPDGKYVVCGWATENFSGGNKFWVARFNKNLSLDSTFGNQGNSMLSFGIDAQARSVSLQSDGKIVVVGHSVSTKQSVVVRLNTNGSLDNTFFNGGYYQSAANSFYDELYGVAISNNNTIYAVGVTKLGMPAVPMVQLNVITPNQKQTNYTIETDAKWYNVAYQADSNKLIVVGQSGKDRDNNRTVPIVFRYRLDTAGGYEIDRTFNGFGSDGFYTANIDTNFVSQDAAFGCALQTDGEILVTGEFNSSFFVTRLTNDTKPAVGINEQVNLKLDVLIAPNPTTGWFTIKAPFGLKSITAYDILGREVAMEDKGANQFYINGNGHYILKITNVNGEVITKRLVVE